MKSKVVRVHAAGGPDVLTIETVDVPAPGPGEVLVRHTAIGVNLVDIYHRSSTAGQYAIPRPATLGVEAAGVVEAVGPDVEGLKPGQRVAYWNFLGAYAERRLVPAWRLVPIPDAVDDRQAAASLVKGATAFYLLTRIWPAQVGASIVVHAAAGGVGQLLCQWASRLGVRVIGVVGSDEKKEVARAAGCDLVVNYRAENFAEAARGFTGGAGVDAVFDSVGRDTFDTSLDCLKPLGLMVNFGQASGPVPPLDLGVLAAKGSLFLAKPTLATFTRTPADIAALTEGVFDAIARGLITPAIGLTASLDDVRSVHESMEARRTTGAIVLVP
ncbi:quinone oxidoreductase family protein [Aquabacter cavernae]|uniref:quinone oxidoreductase family protein n=1 Tax=Aquabacter cavernae TaxID=2496029 RepID=UPI000F8E97FD|nr:quinone oxidoreductase [Aquabacter cavernae]